MQDLDHHGDAGKPLMPTPTIDGTCGKVPLSCEAAGDWLRGAVKDKPNNKVQIATHSCKSSILSMAAKFGLEPSTCRFLGRHSSGRDRSMLVYSRDAMAHPVREMERMIKEINEDRFDLDATRSGYFSKGPHYLLSQKIASHHLVRDLPRMKRILITLMMEPP